VASCSSGSTLFYFGTALIESYSSFPSLSSDELVWLLMSRAQASLNPSSLLTTNRRDDDALRAPPIITFLPLSFASIQISARFRRLSHDWFVVLRGGLASHHLHGSLIDCCESNPQTTTELASLWLAKQQRFLFVRATSPTFQYIFYVLMIPNHWFPYILIKIGLWAPKSLQACPLRKNKNCKHECCTYISIIYIACALPRWPVKLSPAYRLTLRG
jgi:hypothetical protein